MNIHSPILITLIIITIIMLAIRIERALVSPKFQDNFSSIEEKNGNAWHDYIIAPVSFIWNDVILSLFKKSAGKIKNGAFDISIPTVQPDTTSQYDQELRN
jgi:hypothetical protein